MLFGIVLAFILGLVCGGMIMYFFTSGSSESEKAREIEGLKQEEQAYREKVDAHFVESAELFKDLTERYRDVYKHLATGADELCSDEAKQLQTDIGGAALLIEAASEAQPEENQTDVPEGDLEPQPEEAEEFENEAELQAANEDPSAAEGDTAEAAELTPDTDSELQADAEQQDPAEQETAAEQMPDETDEAPVAAEDSPASDVPKQETGGSVSRF